MKIENVHDGIRYTLSNENLEVGDLVFPIANGRCVDDEHWILHDFSFEEYCSGFPNEQHTILDLKHSDYKPYEVRTDHGYSPIQCYYKIIKKEHKINLHPEKMFSSKEWVEI